MIETEISVRAMVPRLMRKKVAWFRRVATADVTIYLSSGNYYWRWYRGYKIFNFLSPPLFLPRLPLSSFSFSFSFFPFFLFSTSSLANSVNNESPRSMVQQLSCFSFLRVSWKQHAISQRILPFGARLFPFQGKYTMSREKVSDRWSWRSSKRRENGFNCQMWRSFMDFWYY